jgi:hypothetical protein
MWIYFMYNEGVSQKKISAVIKLFPTVWTTLKERYLVDNTIQENHLICSYVKVLVTSVTVYLILYVFRATDFHKKLLFQTTL